MQKCPQNHSEGRCINPKRRNQKNNGQDNPDVVENGSQRRNQKSLERLQDPCYKNGQYKKGLGKNHDSQ